MNHVTTVFKNGGSQAVRLPTAYRFDTDKVFIRRDENGDIVLSTRPGTWNTFIEAVAELKIPEDFLDSQDRKAAERNLLDGIS